MDYSELKFTNNFIFCKVLENNLDLCKELLALILKIKIKKVVLADKEKTLDVTPDGKSIRLDVYVEDAAGTVYDIEMQVTSKRNLPKRSRYYQSIIDLNSISKGAKYSDLRKSYVIFICMFDLFGKGLPIYTFKNKCVEDPKLELGDETVKVFVNPYGNTKKLSTGLKSFFDYLKEEIAQSTFTKKLDSEVEKVRENQELRVEYMSMLATLEDTREEGKLLHLIETIYKKMLKGKTNDKIADEVEETIEVVEQVKQSILEYKKEYGNEEFDAKKVLEYYQNRKDIAF